MRILLIIFQTLALLALVAAVLFHLHAFSASAREAPANSIPVSVVLFVFGNGLIDVLIFLAVAIVNLWFVLGPLIKIQEPANRTLVHVSVLFIQALVFLAVTVLTLCLK